MNSMRQIPAHLISKFKTLLVKNEIPQKNQVHYLKWLRYYLDFCQKYHFQPGQKESLPHFVRKLQEKKQTRVQQEQAVTAIILYYEILNVKVPPNKKSRPQALSPSRYVPFTRSHLPPQLCQPFITG